MTTIEKKPRRVSRFSKGPFYVCIRPFFFGRSKATAVGPSSHCEGLYTRPPYGKTSHKKGASPPRGRVTKITHALRIIAYRISHTHSSFGTRRSRHRLASPMLTRSRNPIERNLKAINWCSQKRSHSRPRSIDGGRYMHTCIFSSKEPSSHASSSRHMNSTQPKAIPSELATTSTICEQFSSR